MNIKQFQQSHSAELTLLKEQGGLVGEWENVYEHCLAEGFVAAALGDLLQLSPEEQQRLIKAALLHDWYKRREREAVNMLGAAQYDIKAHESSRLLRNFGYPENIVKLTEAVGHIALAHMQQGADFFEELMHYIDDITAGNTVVALDKRIDQLESAERYKELNEQGCAIFAGRTYFEVQREVGHRIEHTIARLLGIAPAAVVPAIKKHAKEMYDVTL